MEVEREENITLNKIQKDFEIEEKSTLFAIFLYHKKSGFLVNGYEKNERGYNCHY